MSNEVVLVLSKLPKDVNKANYLSFDVVSYKDRLFAGYELYKNFNNYLAKTHPLSVAKFDNAFEAQRYFNNIEF